MESNKIVKSSAHLKSSELVKSSMMIMMMNDGDDDDDDTRPLSFRMSESIELCAQIGPASKTRKCTMSESTELLTHTDAGRDEDPLEDACLEGQRMREFN